MKIKPQLHKFINKPAINKKGIDIGKAYYIENFVAEIVVHRHNLLKIYNITVCVAKINHLINGTS